MRTTVSKCPLPSLGLLFAGAAGFGFLSVAPMLVELPRSCSRYFAGAAILLALYALSLIPTKLVLSEDGLHQRLLLSEFRLRWDDMVEWRHCYDESRVRGTWDERKHTREMARHRVLDTETGRAGSITSSVGLCLEDAPGNSRTSCGRRESKAGDASLASQSYQ